MKKLFPLFFAAVMSILLIIGCTSIEQETDSEPAPAVQQPVSQEPETAAEPAAEPEPVPEPEEFVVTEELYVETFENIKTLIENINKVIASKDYVQWKTFLTDEYIEFYSDPELLQSYSDRLKQRGHNIRIQDFEDYFLNLVVISRSNAVVDEINFTDSDHITAYTKLKGSSQVLYYLEKYENEWKIGLEPEN